MSILLRTGVVYHPDSNSSKEMGAGSEPDTMEAPVAPEDCHQPPPVISIYHHCFGLPYQDHNYGAPPPPTPPQSPPKVNGSLDEDTTSTVLSTTSTAEENEQTEESITRCICEFDHDDEYMICCDKCQVWQHVDCMGIDRNNIPDTYMCEKCQPRKVDRQKAVALQTKKKEEMTDSSSDESGDENATYTTVSSTPTSVTLASNKSRMIKSKKRVLDNRTHKRTKKCKNKIKDKEDSISSSTRQSKKKVKIKEEFTPLNEDTRDSWETALILYSEKYEDAIINQYSIEVQQALGSQKLNGHCGDTTKLLEQLQVQLCKTISMKHRKALIATENISKNQFVVEYRGKLMLRSHFEAQNPFFKRFDPFVLFYTKFNNVDMCIDSREYGNIARFIRRSCSPNSEVRHIVENGSIHLCIYSTEEIKCDDEITIPYDFNYEKCDYFVECACIASECEVEKATKCHKNIEMGPVAKRRRTKRNNSSVDVDSNQSSGAAGSALVNKCRKLSPLRVSLNQNQQTSDSLEKTQENHVEQETEEILAEKQKKMTREERKMEAIMKAFAKMERTEKRRQQALERLANTKLQQQQSQSSPTDQSVSLSQVLVEAQPVQIQAQLITESRTSVSETSSEESKPNTPVVTTRSSRGKKGSRKGQSSTSRWRCRANSGSSDALSPDENSVSMPSTPLTSQLSTDSSVASTPSSANANCAFKFPKTKKILMNEWLNEKAHNVNKPLLIKTEPPDINTATPTCYVKSARSPLALNHLRRISTSGQGKQSNQTSLGSAKKRWLRQAMCETGSSSTEQNSPLANGCHSPIPGSNSNSPSISPPADLLTPLKKRRLMRESLSDGTGDTPPPSSTPEATSIELADLCEKDDSLDEQSLPKNGIKLHFSALNNMVDENSNDEQVWSTTQNDMNFIGEMESKTSQVNFSNNNSKDSSSLQVSSSTEKSDDSFELMKDSPEKEEEDFDKNIKLTITESQKDSFGDVGESEQNLSDEIESSSAVIETVDFVKSLAESSPQSLDIKETRSPDSSCNNNSNNNIDNSSKTLPDTADACVNNTDSETVSASSSSDNIKNYFNQSTVLQTKQESEPDSMEVSLCKCSDPTSGDSGSIDPCIKISDSSHGSPSSTTNSVTESNVCNSTSDDANKPFLFSSVVSSSSSSFVSGNTFAVNNASTSIASVNNASAVSSSETNSTGTNSCAAIGPSDSRPITNTINTTTVSTLPSVTTTTPRTPPVKKKVSLLEYRMRKRDSITTTITSTKSISLACLNTPPKGPVTLSPLPLFEPISPATENGPSNLKKAADSKREARCTTSTGSTEDAEASWNSNSYSDRGTEVRENLTQRLRREFGLIDDEKEKSSGTEDNKISTRSLRTPPPPPPPNKEQSISILPSQKSDVIGSSNHTALQPNGKTLNLYGASSAALIRPANSNVGPRNIPTIISLQSYPPPSRLPPPHSSQPPQYGYQSYNQSVVHGQSLQGPTATGPVPIPNHNNFRQPPPPQFGPTSRPVLHPMPPHPQQQPTPDQSQTTLPPLMPSGNYNDQCPCVPIQGYHDQSQASPVPPMQHYYRDPNKSFNPPPPSSLQPTPPRPQNHFNQGYYQ